MAFFRFSALSVQHRFPTTIVIAWAVCVLLSACERSAHSIPNAQSGPHPTRLAGTALDTAEIERLDGLTSLSVVFSDPSQRALYEMHSPSSDDGRRTYVFQLKPQPGMVNHRHFHLITISWARAGTFVTRPGTPRMQASTGGPSGGFVDAAVQTADEAYDVNVSQAMLLPDTVRIPEFDLERTAATLAQRYKTTTTSR